MIPQYYHVGLCKFDVCSKFIILVVLRIISGYEFPQGPVVQICSRIRWEWFLRNLTIVVAIPSLDFPDQFYQHWWVVDGIQLDNAKNNIFPVALASWIPPTTPSMLIKLASEVETSAPNFLIKFVYKIETHFSWSMSCCHNEHKLK